MAADMFLRSMPNAAAGTAPEVQESGGDDADAAKTPQKAERRATEVLGMTGKRPWKIPKTVKPRELTIIQKKHVRSSHLKGRRVSSSQS